MAVTTSCPAIRPALRGSHSLGSRPTSSCASDSRQRSGTPHTDGREPPVGIGAQNKHDIES